MKRIIRVVIFLLVLISINSVKAIIAAPSCDIEWRDGVLYCDDEIVKNTWIYDFTINKYIYVDDNGNKVKEIDKIEDDPQAKKGTLSISAKVPNNLKDSVITISINSSQYTYQIVLNKDNGFKQDLSVIEDTYSVYYHNVSLNDNIPSPITNNFKVYENRITSFELDYTKYSNEEEVKEKRESNIKKTIIIATIVVFVTAFLIVLLMFMKAKSL